MDAFLIVVAFFWWLSAIFFTAWLAGEKGRSPIIWAILAVFFSPLALIALIGAPIKKGA